MWIRERRVRDDEEAAARRDAATTTAAHEAEARLRGWVERVAVPRHFAAEPRANAACGAALGDALERLGFAVVEQGRYRNVIAVPRGARSPLRIVAAHFDSVPRCPGADDNASGVAVLLEVARRVAASSDGAGVAFIAFNAEEDGLAGSRDFVAHGLPGFDAPVAEVHVLEMVGYRDRVARRQALPLPWVPASLRAPDFVGLLANGGSNAVVDRAVAAAAAPGLRVLAAKTWGPLHRLVPDLARSDHFPFWEVGTPAALWTDTANFRNPNYHRPTDTPDTLDYAFMREIAELLAEVVTAGPRR